ncbi:hypothetical protein AAE478_006486 [Parahypoxylon ruwenzoriense]
MPTTQVSTGLFPVSETTPDSSPGPSPKRHCLQGRPIFPAFGAVEAATALEEGLASRACEKCRASKRKCDKKLPFCDRCKRLNAKCHYVQDVTNNITPHGAKFVIYQPRSLSNDALFRGAEPLESITAMQILSLISMGAGPGYPPGVDWRAAVNMYFSVVHPWFAVVHPILFEQHAPNLFAAIESPPPRLPSLDSDHVVEHHVLIPVPSHSGNGLTGYHTATTTVVNPQSDLTSKELALLIVAMFLNTRMRLTESGEQPIFDETYRTLKRLLSSLLLGCVGDPRPSIEVVQAGALVALYEYGHGDPATAYRTLSQAVVISRVLDIKPGQLADDRGNDALMLSMEEEQSGCLWWGMFILEQFIHQDEDAKGLPFLLESPSRNTLLPETPPMTPRPSSSFSSSSNPTGQQQQQQHPSFPLSPPHPPPAARQRQRLITSSLVSADTEFAAFQLSAKTSSLFHRALRIDKERDARPGKMPLVASYAELDGEIRRTTLTLLAQILDWESTLDCFAMLVSALFTLYLPYLAILERTPAHRLPALLASSSISSSSSPSSSSTPDTKPAATNSSSSNDIELATALAALRFACKMSTDISCKVNADYEAAAATAGAEQKSKSPAYLCAPAGATCYLVIQAFASLGRIFPAERADCEANIAEKFESLKLFSFRWGIAEKMMSRLEKRIGVDRGHYLENSPIAPPPLASCFDLGPR